MLFMATCFMCPRLLGVAIQGVRGLLGRFWDYSLRNGWGKFHLVIEVGGVVCFVSGDHAFDGSTVATGFFMFYGGRFFVLVCGF